jgi:hypothetical protein
MVSANVVRFQSEDALYIHSDIVAVSNNDVLQEVYTTGVPDFGIINYRCQQYEVMAKPMSAITGNVYRFSLTDEFATVMNLNGLNWVMTLMVFTETRPLMLQTE